MRCRIKLADGFDLVAKQLNPNWPVRLGRINVENAAAQSVFARHFNNVRGIVANRIEMLQQIFRVQALTAAKDSRQVRVKLSRSQP